MILFIASDRSLLAPDMEPSYLVCVSPGRPRLLHLVHPQPFDDYPFHPEQHQMRTTAKMLLKLWDPEAARCDIALRTHRTAGALSNANPNETRRLRCIHFAQAF
jgi:hypothetical protein